MNEKGANIDLLFRNGLKDFEVLPPANVWESVHSAVKTKSRQYLFYKAAAAITILITLGILTYVWSRQLSVRDLRPVVSFNVPSSLPAIMVPADKHIKGHVKKSVRQVSPSGSSEGISNVTAEATEEFVSVSPEQIVNFRESKSLSLGNKKIEGSSYLAHLNSEQTAIAKIKYPELQYFPVLVSAKPVKKWSIAAMASPTYYSSFTSNSDELSKQLASSEQSLISYSGGVSFSYKISKKFTLQSGLYYSSLGQKLDGINSYSGFRPYDNAKGDHNFEVLTSTGVVYANNPDIYLSSEASGRIISPYSGDIFDPKKASLQPVSNSLSQNFSYLEFPVVLRYKLIDKTFGINLIGGLSYNMLVHNSVYTTLNGSRYSIGDTRGLNPLTLSSSLGMGMEYNFSDKLSLNLEPTFRYYLNPFSVTTGLFTHPYSFGIFSGVSYKF